MNPRHIVLQLLSVMFLLSIPMYSQATDCAEAKERYWTCIRASMTSKPCQEGDNLSIPPECLIGGSESQKEEDSFKSSTPSIFGSPKEPIPSHYEPDVIQRKPVKVINIKAMNTKPYIETEDDVNQLTTKIREGLLGAIKEGKRVRLQFD